MPRHYARIYAPDGQPFDVPEERAAELVLNSGWTRTLVVDAEPPDARLVTTVELPAPAAGQGYRKRTRRARSE